jgi:hypothetical protein
MEMDAEIKPREQAQYSDKGHCQTFVFRAFFASFHKNIQTTGK